MTRGRLVIASLSVFMLLACKRERGNKNDDIAACQASGGSWVEGGCNDDGRCQRPSGAAPELDDVLDEGEPDDGREADDVAPDVPTP